MEVTDLLAAGALIVSVFALALSGWNTWRAEGRPARDRQRHLRAEVWAAVSDLHFHLEGRANGYTHWDNLRRVGEITPRIKDPHLRWDLEQLQELYTEHENAWGLWSTSVDAQDVADADAEESHLRRLAEDRERALAAVRQLSGRIDVVHRSVEEHLRDLEAKHG